MNKVLLEISKIAQESIKKYLPKVSSNNLEGNGKIFYMNDKNGTAFDYYSNNHLSPFMVFYDDEENMGAVKIILYADGKIDVCIFENHGNKLCKQVSDSANASSDEIFKLAVLMNKIADTEGKFGASIEDMNSDIQITELEINEFVSIKEV